MCGVSARRTHKKKKKKTTNKRNQNKNSVPTHLLYVNVIVFAENLLWGPDILTLLCSRRLYCTKNSALTHCRVGVIETRPSPQANARSLDGGRARRFRDPFFMLVTEYHADVSVSIARYRRFLLLRPELVLVLCLPQCLASEIISRLVQRLRENETPISLVIVEPIILPGGGRGLCFLLLIFYSHDQTFIQTNNKKIFISRQISLC